MLHMILEAKLMTFTKRIEEKPVVPTMMPILMLQKDSHRHSREREREFMEKDEICKKSLH